MFNHNLQEDNSENKTQYIHLKPRADLTTIRISRLKGHPKIFLYNCEVDKI